MYTFAMSPLFVFVEIVSCCTDSVAKRRRYTVLICVVFIDKREMTIIVIFLIQPRIKLPNLPIIMSKNSAYLSNIPIFPHF